MAKNKVQKRMERRKRQLTSQAATASGSTLVAADTSSTGAAGLRFISVESNTYSESRSRKRRKKSNILSAEVPEDLPRRDQFSILPFELLAEILCTTSPKEVLAVARCSRHLCNTLVNFAVTDFIWRRARANCLPQALPDPLPNFTEASYASFIFDGGTCDQCGKICNSYYRSFALRIRVCGAGGCYMNWKSSKGTSTDVALDKPYKKWLLHTEDNGLGEWDFVDRPTYRTSDVKFAEAEHSEFLREMRTIHSPEDLKKFMTSYNERRVFDAEKKERIMQHALVLQTWRRARIEFEEEVKQFHLTFTRSIADEEGWKFWDLANAPTFASLMNAKKRMLAFANMHDFYPIRDAVEGEIGNMVGHRQRHKEEVAYQGRREEVAKLYQRLRSKDPYIAIPILPIFRELSVIKVIQNKRGKDPEDVCSKLASTAFQSLLEDNLATWREITQRKFLALMGMPKYQHISETKLHPLDRITARFNCVKCMETSRRSYEPVSLDFVDACKHQCGVLSKTQVKDPKSWKVEQFVFDEKASNATKKALKLLGREDDNPKHIIKNLTKSENILCDSCDGVVILNIDMLQEHCHRHEDMKFSPFASCLNNPPIVTWGLRDELMGRAKSAPARRRETIYGCKHCLERSSFGLFCRSEERHDEEGSKSEETTVLPQAPVMHSVPSAVTLPAEGSSAGEQEQGGCASNLTVGRLKKKMKAKKVLFHFDGLRSHLNALHGVPYISDEDFYRVRE